MRQGTLGRKHYVAIAAFRHQLRRFLSFSEAAAAKAGLPAQQHQALLAILGHSEPDPPTVGMIAEQLIVAPHTAAELVSRMVVSGLITKTPSSVDRRRLELALTAKAVAIMAGLTQAHLQELETLRTSLNLAAQQARFVRGQAKL